MPRNELTACDLENVHGGANPLNVSADKVKPGMVNVGPGNTFQRLNCVKASDALPNPPAALKDTWVCTNDGATMKAPGN